MAVYRTFNRQSFAMDVVDVCVSIPCSVTVISDASELRYGGIPDYRRRSKKKG